MRLSTFEQQSIITNFQNIFPKAKLYLFGSRIDDEKKGGDIDLYIETKSSDYSYSKLLDFSSLIQEDIGMQKIDMVVNKLNKNIDKAIYKNAQKEGVLLWMY